MRNSLSQRQRLAASGEPSIGIAERPVNHSGDVRGASPGVMATKKETVGPMLLRVVKLASLLTMFTALGGLAGKPVGSPGRVMRLQAQSAIRPIFRQS